MILRSPHTLKVFDNCLCKLIVLNAQIKRHPVAGMLNKLETSAGFEGKRRKSTAWHDDKTLNLGVR